MHLKVIIVNLKKLIYKHRYLYSIVFFFKSVLYGWCFNLEIANLASEKIKPETILKSSKNTKKNSVFIPWLKRRDKAFCWSCLCWCSVSQALLGFLHQEPLEGKKKLKYTNMSKCCGKGNLSISHMGVFWFHFDLLIFSYQEIQRLSLQVQKILTEMKNNCVHGCGLKSSST